MSPMFQTILVPVDFSPSASTALRYAARIAERFGSSLLVMHVIAKEVETGMVCRHVGPQRIPLLGPEATPMAVLAEMLETVTIDLREQAQMALHHFVASRPIARPVELRVEVGHPVEQILDVVTRDDVDLIVMGTHGRTGLAHAVMGSVAERVIRLLADAEVDELEHRVAAEIDDAVAFAEAGTWEPVADLTRFVYSERRPG